MRARSSARQVVRRIAFSAALSGGAWVVACGGGGDKPASDSAQNAATPSATAQAAPGTGAKVTDIRIGIKMDATKQVTRQTDIFAAKDTLFASVHTVGAAPNTEVIGRWTFQDGKTVDEQKQPVNPPADAWNGFQSVKTGGWPIGTYTFHVLLNGQEVQKRDVKVVK